jgi:hypothetical protein
MTNDTLNTEAVRQLLNRSLGRLEPSTLAGLRAARERALSLHAPATTGPRLMSARRRMVSAFATVMVTVSLFGGVAYYWQQANDTSDTDIAILTDEMPVDVYAD